MKRVDKRKSHTRRYGLSDEDYAAMLEAQGNRCPMCERDMTDLRIHVDHDHKCCPKNTSRTTCGKCVRGLLCGTCNQALGFYEKHYRNAAKYLAAARLEGV